MEAQLHREREDASQWAEAYLDWSDDGAYKAVDSSNIGFVDMKTLDGFFKRLFTKGLTLEDHSAIVRRLDLDSDGKLRKDEFVKGVIAQEPYSKMLIRHEHKKEEAFGKEYQEFLEKKKKEGERRPKDPKAVKAHNESMANKFN